MQDSHLSEEIPCSQHINNSPNFIGVVESQKAIPLSRRFSYAPDWLNTKLLHHHDLARLLSQNSRQA